MWRGAHYGGPGQASPLPLTPNPSALCDGYLLLRPASSAELVTHRQRLVTCRALAHSRGRRYSYGSRRCSYGSRRHRGGLVLGLRLIADSLLEVLDRVTDRLAQHWQFAGSKYHEHDDQNHDHVPGLQNAYAHLPSPARDYTSSLRRPKAFGSLAH